MEEEDLPRDLKQQIKEFELKKQKLAKIESKYVSPIRKINPSGIEERKRTVSAIKKTDNKMPFGTLENDINKNQLPKIKSRFAPGYKAVPIE